MGPIGLPFPAAPVAARQIAESPTRECALRTDPPDAQLLVLPGEQFLAHATAPEAFRAEPSSRQSSIAHLRSPQGPSHRRPLRWSIHPAQSCGVHLLSGTARRAPWLSHAPLAELAAASPGAQQSSAWRALSPPHPTSLPVLVFASRRLPRHACSPPLIPHQEGVVSFAQRMRISITSLPSVLGTVLVWVHRVTMDWTSPGSTLVSGVPNVPPNVPT